jgi:hypothetical protein
MKYSIGLMKGKLSPPVDAKIQAFPQDPCVSSNLSDQPIQFHSAKLYSHLIVISEE